MDPQHWLDRWDNGQIGFHQGHVNTHLETFWSGSGIAPGCRVFVPLCGKSLDMLWLRAQGHEVLGIEISPKAVSDFFEEHGLEPSVSRDATFERWQSDGLTLLVGDFFDLRAADLQGVGAVYDRASLIALPPSMRSTYARHMAHIKPAGATTLLISVEYPQAEMNGPPFSVEETEVRALYEPAYRVECLADIDALPDNPRFQQRGLSRLHEKVYRLRAP